MKKAIIILSLLFCFTVNAQQTTQKKDSLLVTIQMDSAAFKQIVQLIQENINGNTLTSKIVLQNILQPFYSNARFLPQIQEADKPKEVIKPIKK